MRRHRLSSLLVPALLALASALSHGHALAQAGGKAAAAPLKAFSFTVTPGSYLSLHEGKVYAAAEAPAHKGELDFVYLVARDGGYVKRELYDLSGKDTHLPAEVLGNKAGIVALGWDDELVARCKTTADLKRMTGSYSAASFSFYGVVTNNRSGDLDGKRFIFLDSKGRMGLFSVKLGSGDDLLVEGKITP